MEMTIKWKSGLIVLAVAVGPFVACSSYVKVNPDGFPAGGPESYEGLIAVGERGWDYATIDTLALLILNERQRRFGKQTTETICLLSADREAKLTDALSKAPRDRNGYRAIWVKMVAKPRYSSSVCSNWHRRRPNGQSWGRHLLILSVQSADPIPCAYNGFIWNRRRCIKPTLKTATIF